MKTVKKKIAKKPCQKQDSNANSIGVEQAVMNQRKRERWLYPLRINSHITLLVPKRKCNEKYAKWYRENRLEHGERE